MHAEGPVYMQTHFDVQCNGCHERAGTNCRNRRRRFAGLSADNDIAPKRLLAVPWAQFCIRYQEAVDRSLEEIQPPSGDLLGRAA